MGLRPKNKFLGGAFFFFFFFFGLFRATRMAHGGSQASGPFRAVAAGLCHSHSNNESKPSLQPIPQLMATPDPQPTEQGQGSNPRPYECQSDSLTAELHIFPF